MKKTKLFYLFLVLATIFTTSCDEDEIINALTLSNNDVVLLPGANAKITVKTGNQGYVAVSANEAIATAMVKDKVITITAVKAGSTMVNVSDDKGKKAVIKVTVKSMLALEKNTATVVEGANTMVAIKSGSGKYEVMTSDKAIATAVVDGTNVKITGVAKGNATITVKDTDTKVTKEIKVVVKPALAVEKTDVAIVEGGKEMVQITKGTGNYTVASSDDKVVTATVDKNVITFTAVAAGTAKVTVTDTETNTTAEINVEVKPSLNFDDTEAVLFEGEEKVITIEKGTGNYTATSSKKEVATVAVDGKNIKITAVKKGEAIITITDSETKKEKEIKVTVKARLALAKTELAINQGETERVDVLNVVDDSYEVVQEPADVLKVEKGGGMNAPDGLKITPLKYNKEAVKVTVKSGGQEAVLMVTVNPVEKIKLNKSEVAMLVTAKEEVRIIKGNGGYKVEVDKADVVKAEVKLVEKPNQTPEYVVALEAKTKGMANVKVTDVAGKEVTIKVTVKEGLKLAKTELTINQGETERVAVVNVVNDSYEIVAEPADVLKVEKGGTDYEGSYVDALVITPLKYSKEAVKVTVKSGEQEAVLMVTVNPVETIKLSKTETALEVEAKEEIRIIKGNGGYTVAVENADFVKAEVKLVEKPNQTPEYVVALEGKAEGTTNVKVTDVAGKEVTIKVTVNAKPDPNAIFNIDADGLVYKKEGAVVKGDIVIPDAGLKIAAYGYSGKISPFASNEEVISVDLNNVTDLGKMAFSSCKGLKVVHLRKVEKFSGFGVFYKCESLKEVYCYMEDPSTFGFGGYDFNGTPEDKVLYVPKGKVDAYKATKFNDFFKTIKEMGGSDPVQDADVEIDENGLVYEKDGVELEGDLRVPDAGTTIARYTGDKKNSPFAYKSKITSIDFNNVTNLKGTNCVAKCKDLTTIHMRKVTDIGSGAFYYCTKLKAVYCYTDDAPSIPFGARNSAFKGIDANAILYVPKGRKDAYAGTKLAKFFSEIKEME